MVITLVDGFTLGIKFSATHATIELANFWACVPASIASDVIIAND